MLEKRKCDKCESIYDKTFDKCPNCHDRNLEMPEDFKNIPMFRYGKQIAFFLYGWAGLKLIGLIISLIVLAINGPVAEEQEIMIDAILNFSCYGVLFVGLLFIGFEELPKLVKKAKSWKPYVAGVVALIVMIVFQMLYRMFLSLFGIALGSNENDDGIQKIVAAYPVWSVIIFAFVAPICEELTYRVGLFSFLKRKNKYLAYIVTILIFALIHFTFGAEDLVTELLNLPLYIIPAFCLTYTYDNYGFASSLTTHILNNILGTVSAMFIFGFVF